MRSSSKRFKNALKTTAKWAFATVAVLFIVAVLAVNLAFPMAHTDAINRSSAEFGVDKSLIYAVIWTESKFDTEAVSGAGAVGLMQLMPKTAEWCASQTGQKYRQSDLLDPDTNIRLGTYYLSYLIDKYGQKDALAAYNAGEGNLALWDGEIKFKETRDFVKRVGFAKKIYKLKLR